MNEIWIKGTVFGISSDEWRTDSKILPSMLLSILETWNIRTFDRSEELINDINVDLAREYGKINAAKYGFVSDLHNLSINYSMINKIAKDNLLNNGVKSLYIGLLVENYVTNIRSCYDFTSLFPRFLIDLKSIRRLTSMKNSDSLNTLLKFCEKEKNIFPESIYRPLTIVKSDLEDIKNIRDSIIHHGKEPIVHIENNSLTLRIPKSAPYRAENALPDILSIGAGDYPLLAYLRELTLRLVNYTEDLGNTLFDELRDKDNTYKVFLTALIGVCIKDFREYITTPDL